MIQKYRKLLLALLFLFLFCFCVYYTYYLRPLVDDELYNFGFAKNIVNGLVPYVDFNMIVPPFFHYIVSLFVIIFGNHLLVYHCIIAFIVVSITYLSYRKVGFLSLVIYCFLLIYPYTGYNTFCLFLFMILLFMDFDNDYLCALLICCMCLSKQTLGILMIPNLIYAKKRGKVFSIYCVVGCLFLLYLLLNQSLYQFLDYCFLGMFHFTSKNSSLTVFLFVEIVIILVLSFLIFKTKKKEYSYILAFQIMAFPIVNYVHFWISFVPVLFLLIQKFKKHFVGKMFFMGFGVAYFVIFTCSIFFTNRNYQYLGKYSSGDFMRNRVTYLAVPIYVADIDRQIQKYSDYNVYLLGSFSYLVKLNLDISINKYDIINEGNMGYLGYQGYINDIDSFCKEKKCLFIINDDEAAGKIENQVSLEILNYVINNYEKKYSSNTFSVYVN